MRGWAGSYWGMGQGRSCSKGKGSVSVSCGHQQGPPCEPGREGHPGQAYLTLELGCELGWPGCGDGCGGGGIDCGVCTCWPGDGEDSMVRLFWLTWKWRGLSLLACHPLSLPLSPCSHPLRLGDPTWLHAQPLLSLTASLHTLVFLRCPASQILTQARAPPLGYTHTW